jgi:hypothetical protein
MEGQSFYRFPEGAAPDDEDLVDVLPYYVGIPASKTIVQIQSQIASYGYAVGKLPLFTSNLPQLCSILCLMAASKIMLMLTLSMPLNLMNYNC